MPGTTIVWLLDAHTYEKFYWLAHEYSELLIGRASSTQMVSLVMRIANTIPEDTGQTLHKFKTDLREMEPTTKKFTNVVRGAFWPNSAGNNKDWDEARLLNEAFNHERWSPYDAVAWDRFFADVAATIRPVLEIIKQGMHSLELPTDGSNSATAGETLNKLSQIISSIQNHLQELETLLNDDGFEAEYARRAHSYPDKAQTYIERALKRLETDYDGQIADYTEAIYFDNHPASWHNRGVARRNKGDQKGAISDFTQAIRLDSTYATAYYNRAGVYAETGEKEAAVADYGQFLELIQTDTRASHAHDYIGRYGNPSTQALFGC